MDDLILVTGGTGFIGGNLVDLLLERKKNIRILVKPGCDIKKFLGKKVEIIYGDLTDKESLRPATKGVNIIYHLAAILPYMRHPDKQYYLVNTIGTQNLLDVCKKANIQRFIYFSSISVLGSSYKRIILNEESPCNPTTFYGVSKYSSEQILLSAFKKDNIPVVILRAPMVYGPGDAGNLPMRNKVRSFCYVGNLIDASYKAAELNNAVGKVYFISDDDNYTLEYFIDSIAEAMGVRLLKIILPLRVWKFLGWVYEIIFRNDSLISRRNIERLCTEFEICDIAKAKGELGYAPPYSLKEGLCATVSWYRKHGFLH